MLLLVPTVKLCFLIYFAVKYFNMTAYIKNPKYFIFWYFIYFLYMYYYLVVNMCNIWDIYTSVCVCVWFCFSRPWDRVSLCSSHGCPGTPSKDQPILELRDPPASAFQLLWLMACITSAQFLFVFLKIECQQIKKGWRGLPHETWLVGHSHACDRSPQKASLGHSERTLQIYMYYIYYIIDKP